MGRTARTPEVIGGDNRNPMLKMVGWKLQRFGPNLSTYCIGYKGRLKTVIYCVVDGRGASAGVTTNNWPNFMKSAGAYTAFNMDGGGSSSMYIKEFNPGKYAKWWFWNVAVWMGIFAVSSNNW